MKTHWMNLLKRNVQEEENLLRVLHPTNNATFLSTIIESERQKNEGLLISSCTKKDESFQWKSKVFRNFFKSKDGEIFSDRPPIAHDWSVAQNSEDWCQQISHFWLFEALLSLITNRFFSPLRKTQTETEHQQIQQYFIQIYSQKLDKMEMVFSKCDVFFCCWFALGTPKCTEIDETSQSKSQLVFCSQFTSRLLCKLRIR